MTTQTLPTLTLEPALETKWQALVNRLRELDSVVVAFSGGVDSSMLAAAAHLILQPRMFAVTIRSQVETVGIMETAASIAAQFGFPHQVIDYDKLNDQAYVDNTPDRCYVCKSVDLGIISEIAQKAGIRHVLMGANADDLGDYRPGLRAAAELSVVSPLAEVGLTKKEVRMLARELGLANWNHPSSPCLASRIPYGIKVTRDKLEQIAQGESYLRALNFDVVRVRNNGVLARIEVLPDEIGRLMSLREEIVAYFKQIGFQYVTVDLEGFRSGSLNEVLKRAQ
ncbi:MAG: ATP-dependent sacrificial sulfur transferase LarE [Chloroflexi bacterium]|nr:ATP-dependent sacrificial sulfur transferase LarE [Chloroflexota bacterium]